MRQVSTELVPIDSSINNKKKVRRLDIMSNHGCRKFFEKQAYIRVSVKEFEDELEEKLFVIEYNLKRRHLTDAQKVEIAHTLKPIYEEKARQNKYLAGKLYGKGVDSTVSNDTELSSLLPIRRVNEIVAKEVGLSTSTYYRGETILEQNPQLW